jgi:UDP-2,3-diacylglucosamine hydrolase
MQGVLFASDLHLSGLRPDRAALAVELLRLARGRASRVYLLGDLVEFWLGDDDPDPIHRALVDTLASLTRAGAGLHVARGNRDFLLGERFRAETGSAPRCS